MCCAAARHSALLHYLSVGVYAPSNDDSIDCYFLNELYTGPDCLQFVRYVFVQRPGFFEHLTAVHAWAPCSRQCRDLDDIFLVNSHEDDWDCPTDSEMQTFSTIIEKRVKSLR
jgi:hypothetical protein